MTDTRARARGAASNDRVGVTGHVILRRGDTGAAVRDLQQRLAATGAAIGRAGTYDADTEAAVRAFQEERNLRVDGICGPETWGALVESGFRPGDRLLYLRQPMLRGDDVQDLQHRLNALGFDAGREDGILGPETEDAIRAFQRNAGLAPDGVCGPGTRAALERLGTLAAGSVAAVRERETLLRAPQRLEECKLFLVVDPALAAIGAAVTRTLRDAGTLVVLDTSGDDHSVLAAQANRFEADVFAAFLAGEYDAVRCVYFANNTFRSEAGFSLACRLTGQLRGLLAGVEEPVGRTYRLLRETRMAAVVCELADNSSPDGASVLSAKLPALSRALVEGIRRGLEEPAGDGDG